MQTLLFIALNIMDAYLTKISLQIGAIEANPLMTHIGGIIIAKGIIAAALVFILYYFQKDKVLWMLNILLLGVILWNSAVYGILNLSPLDNFMIS